MNFFYTIFLLWILSEVYLNRSARSAQKNRASQDANTEWLLWITIVVSMTSGIFISGKFSFPITSDEITGAAGITLVISGIILRFIAIRQLGKNFTVDVSTQEDQELKQDGFYRYLRHPSYSASLLSFGGFGLFLNNWISLIIVIVLPFLAFKRRINVEEEVLLKQFGKQYSDYISKTRRIIPFLY